ncbi:MAG: YkgJ family cysteine cluster protein [Rectinemataceae bacterium]
MAYEMQSLRFSCTRCNSCCSGSPGFVWLSIGDLDALCRRTGLSRREFAEAYCRVVDLGALTTLSLREKENFDCIFLKKTGCCVYDARPAQCRTYPFWESIIESRRSWEAEGQYCPGIGKGVPVPSESILDAILERRANPPLSLKEIPELSDMIPGLHA